MSGAEMGALSPSLFGGGSVASGGGGLLSSTQMGALSPSLFGAGGTGGGDMMSGLMAGGKSVLSPQGLQNINTMNSLLGGGQQQQQQQQTRLPPPPGVPAQNMGAGMPPTPQINPQSLIVGTTTTRNPLEEWLRLQRMGY